MSTPDADITRILAYIFWDDPVHLGLDGTGEHLT
jgi:hypothetical protein